MELRARHGICGDDIESIRVAGSEKLVSHHSIHDPQDIAMAQYSAPFSIALACYRDPRDPAAFCEHSLNDPAIRSLCRKTVLELYPEAPKDNKLASKVTLQLKDGRELMQELQYFPGMPQRPLTSGQLWEKFHRLTAALPNDRKRSLFDSFLALETISDVAQLEFI
jgi:2-methylcitrate dehydratase PrpD